MCAISSSYPGSFVGSVGALLTQAQAQGIEVDFVFPPEAREHAWCRDFARRTNVFYVDVGKAALNPSSYLGLAALMMADEYDLIHSHYEAYDIPLTLIKKRYKLRCRLIWHLHCNPLSSKKTLSLPMQWYDEMKYRVFPGRCTILAINESDRRLISRYAKKADVQVLPNGIDLNGLNDLPDDGRTVPGFVSLCWDFYRKGGDVILKACELLQARGRKFRLTLNGNDDTKAELDRRFGTNWPEYLAFQPPQYDRSDVFKTGDVLLVASRWETFNYTIAETSYLGKRVITSEIPGTEWSFGLPNVTTFPSEDAEALAERMDEYLLHGEEHPFDREAVRKTLREQYSSEHWAQELLKIYQKQLEEG